MNTTAMNTNGTTSEPAPKDAPEAAVTARKPLRGCEEVEPTASPIHVAPLPLRSAVNSSQPMRDLGSRLVYWVPVFAALVLFAQVAFLGLRPAMREASRLASASDMLHERWTHDRALYDAYETQLAARRDPIFRERQSRLRRGARPLAETPATIVVSSGDASNAERAWDVTSPTRPEDVSNPSNVDSATTSTSGF